MKQKKLWLSAILAVVIVAMLGIITVVATDNTDTQPNLSIYAQNLAFEDSIYIKYAVAVENADTDQVELLIWTTPQSNYTYGTQQYVLTSGEEQTISGNICAIFSFSELAAKQMTDVVYARAHISNGENDYYSDVQKYSVLQYVYNKLGKTGTATTNENLKALLNNMLLYGASAQTYLNYRTDSLATMDFYQVKVVGGTLSDLCDNGLYLAGTEVTLTAPATNADGNTFQGWQNSAGTTVGTTSTLTVTVGTSNETYTAVYQELTATADEYFTFTPLDDGTYSIAAKDINNMPAEVVLPNTYNGKAVTTIPVNAFDGCNTITDITISNTITTIDIAFSNCFNLNSVTIPESVSSISPQAFMNCTGLTKITVDPNNPTYTSIAGNLYSKDCNTIIRYAIGKTDSVFTIPYCAVIGDYAFAYASNLTKVVIPDNATNIGIMAFAYCTSLTDLEIPENVTTIGSSAFAGCTELTSVEIPSKVTTIESATFLNCKNLKSVTIPNSVKYIWKWAFQGCSNLTSVIIPSSVLYIASGCFDGTMTVYCEAASQPDAWASDWAASTVTVVWGYGAATANEYFTFTLLSDDTYSIKAADNTNMPAEVILPGTYNGKSVTMIEYSAFYDCKNIISIDIPDSYTTIDEGAFLDCSNLSCVIIPHSVTTIGNSVFDGCYSLSNITVDTNNSNYCSIDGNLYNKNATTIIRYARGKTNTVFTIPDSVTTIYGGAFSYSTNLTSIILSPNLKTIEGWAFSYCDNLKSITIPDSVTSIGFGVFTCDSSLTNIYFGENSNLTIIDGAAFQSCTQLKTFDMPNSVKSIGDYTFSNCTNLTNITLSSNIKNISGGMCEGCSSLLSVSIPSGVSKIEGGAFQGCNSLKTVVLPDSLTEIASSAFSSCTSLENITIPEKVSRIGDSAFAGCSSLTTISIPNSVTNIEQATFQHCSKLTNISIPKNIINIGEWAFNGCSSLTSITIPNSVTTINDNAFSNCSNLTNIIFGGESELTYIGAAFQNCSMLENIIIPNKVTYIGGYAFSGCGNLISITLPESLTGIDSYAFYNCSKLNNVIIPKNVTKIGLAAFRNCSSLISVTFNNYEGWNIADSNDATGTPLVASEIENKETAATYLTSTYLYKYWSRI